MKLQRDLLCAALALFLSSSAFSGPYMGIQFKQLNGTRSTLDYKTNQTNLIAGYELQTESGLRHAVEYVGAIGSSSGQIGPYNVETTIMTIGYKLMYRGFYAKLARAKLDRDDRDLERTSDRARLTAIGYEYEFNPTTSIHVTREWMKNSNLSMHGYSIGAIFRW